MIKFLNKLNLLQKTLIVIVVILIVSAVYMGISTFRKVYMPNVIVNGASKGYLYIKTGSTIDDVCRSLYENNYIINRQSFEWMAEKKNYASHIKAGKFKIHDRMNNKDLVDMLRSGKQVPVRVSFNNIRLKTQLAGVVSRYLEADSCQFLELLNDEEYLQSIGFSTETSMALFIPNTYEFFWNTSAREFVDRMKKENDKFWNTERLEKSSKLGLNKIQVFTLASIVDEESNTSAEFATIAGLYLNRIKIDMPLQADPTVKFAMGNFALKRVLKKHTEYDSPYNTYKNKGIPPGPICLPSIKAINAVLNAEKHNYLYFCAKSDFSGAHVFAKNLIQHNKNAVAYQTALNKRRIY
jgi:UPF0755 protein